MNRRPIVRHATFTAMIFIVAVMFGLLMVYGVTPWLRDKVVVRVGTIDRWLELYQTYSVIVVVIAGTMGILWYVLGAWSFRVVKWTEGRKRLVWGSLMALVAAAVIVAAVLTPSVQRGWYFAIIGYAIAGLGCYYLTTLLFSPPSHKYAPAGAMAIRRWW